MAAGIRLASKFFLLILVNIFLKRDLPLLVYPSPLELVFLNIITAVCTGHRDRRRSRLRGKDN